MRVTLYVVDKTIFTAVVDQASATTKVAGRTQLVLYYYLGQAFERGCEFKHSFSLC
jgi:hypothetical protein